MKLRSFYKSSPQVDPPLDIHGPSTSEQAITEQPNSNLSPDISISESNISIERMTPDSKIFDDESISDPDVSSEQITPNSDISSQRTISELNVSREEVKPDSDISPERTASEADLPLISPESVSSGSDRIRGYLRSLLKFCNIYSPSFLGCLFTWVNAFLLLFAIYFDPWRLFSVDRAALQRMVFEGRIDISLLQENISMTRTQGIFQECILHHPSSTISIGNETNYFTKSICYNILPTVIRSETTNQHFILISKEIENQQELVYMMLAITALLIIFGTISEVRIQLTALFNLIIIFGGIFNAILHLLFFVIANSLEKGFNREDPSFPVPWPKAIREATLIDTWQAGPIRWLVAMGCQVLVIVFNVQRIRQPEVMLPN